MKSYLVKFYLLKYLLFFSCCLSIFLVVCLSITISSCGISDLKSPNTLINLGQISFVLNGKTYQMQGRGILATSQPKKGLFITGTNTEKESISLNINDIDSIFLNKIEKNVVVAFASNGVTQATNFCLQSTTLPTISTVTITVVQLDRQAKTISGKFSGTLCTMQNTTSVITNGNFNVEFD